MTGTPSNSPFLLTPLREGRPSTSNSPLPTADQFLLTPLREGRRTDGFKSATLNAISTHAPAGGATITAMLTGCSEAISTHAPAGGATLRRGLQHGAHMISTHAPAGGATPARICAHRRSFYFYSRPCGRGDRHDNDVRMAGDHISTHAPAGGATDRGAERCSPSYNFYSRPCGRGDSLFAQGVDGSWNISTHAPAGGATAIFHKSVMRFCGKLPKDDTVLCLASFGFPRRDPKAVYLAWISCANLPQKCVREGLALKDQGTSCFHEGLASHAFDPVLV